MNQFDNIRGDQVKNLITKFYYKSNMLFFSILIETISNKSVAYYEYSDYSEYKKAFDSLLDAKAHNKLIHIPKGNIQPTHISLS